MRLLLKSPGFAITAVLILGFGIGANTAIFSLIDTVLLNSLPFPKADRLIRISQRRANAGYWAHVDYLDYEDIRSRQHTFDSLAIFAWDFLDLSGQGSPQRLTVAYASASLFQVTNLPFILGRPFTEDEDKSGGPLVVVLSESLWRSRFNSDPNIIGKNLTLSGESFQVVGICPRQVEDVGTPPIDLLYVPAHVGEVFGDTSLQKRDQHVLACFGRLKNDVTPAQAQADLEIIQNNLAGQYPEADKGYEIHLIPLRDVTVATYSSTVWLLGTAVGCLLLISCATIANLLFARALERRKEMTIRATLGASRCRLIGQLLLETGFLSLMGGTVGLLVALLSIALIRAVSPEYLYRFQEVSLNTTALSFIFGVTALVSLLSGLLPAWNLSKANLGSALKDEGGRAGTISRQRQRAQSLLVTGQVALACVLLIGAGLLVRSFRAALTLPLGFNPHHLLTANINPTSNKYTSDVTRLRHLWDAVLEKARGLPGITDAGMNSQQPFEYTFGDPNAPFHVPGQPDSEPGKEPTMCPQDISSGYFKTAQIPLLQGRDFNAEDRADSQHVVIIDEALAQRFFPGQDPVGKQIEDLSASGSQKTWTIVGVVQNSRHHSPDHPLASFQAYFPYTQRENLFWQFLLLRTPGDPNVLVSAVRKIVAEVDSDVPVTNIMRFDDLIADRFWARRLGVLLVSIFSGAALFLSAVGLYGVLAYSVSQRRREIGVRIALGAQASNILRLVIRQGLKLVCFGLVVGIVSALIIVRFIDSILYGVSGNDPVSFALAVVVLGLAALLACLLPALRATRINPITALRE
jgi:predicted permease